MGSKEDNIDLAIFVGDVCPMTDHNPIAQFKWLRDTWLPYLRELPVKNVVWIFGNHDFVGDIRTPIRNYVDGFKPEELYDLLYGDPRIHYLENESTVIDGIKIYGYPYVGNLIGWAFNREPSVLEDYASRIPPCDILVTHAPPYGFGDKTTGGYYVGDTYLSENLKRINPKLVLCGHIHEGRGEYRHPNIELGINNVAYLNERYEHKLHLIPVRFEIDATD